MRKIRTANTFAPTMAGPASTKEPAVGEATPDSPARTYDFVAALGIGGMGEVARVRDPVLGRTLVRKTVRADLIDAGSVQRFLAEAELTARLEHPAIVPVYDIGRLPDGRPFFIMKEVRGETLTELVRDAGAHLPRRLLEAVQRVAEAVAYAHGMGVIHRDIKPANVMVGGFGEVALLDWGIARVLADAEMEPVTAPEGRGRAETRVGTAMGTPGFMPPEQAHGDRDAMGPWSDVYALGALLVYVLTGQPPGPSLRPVDVPLDLWEIAQRALSPAPADRYPDGAALAAALASWRDGDARRDRAHRRVEAARERIAGLEALRAEARSLSGAAVAKLVQIKSWEPVERKREAWTLEDAASRTAREAELEEVAVVQLLGAAIADAPELDDAHALLADLYRARHEEAEAARDGRATARWEALLRAHDRGGHGAYLAGIGTLTIHADATEATLCRLEERDRRLVPVSGRDVWPITDLPLEAGSWLVTLRAPGRSEVQYPVQIARGAHWDGVPPRESAGHAIRLPGEGELGPDDVFVPAGWTWIGGTQARNALPRQRVWVDGFVMRRHPVTNREYIVFLDDLVDHGREDEALLHQPLREGREFDWRARAVFGRDATGHFLPVPDPEGDVWDLDWPVVCVTWENASAFTDWMAERTGSAWRLPSEIEREKAGRGADGRTYPWGDYAEPTWAVNLQRQSARAVPGRVSECPTDRSVYGIDGLAGNARDWCLEPRGPGALWVADDRLVVPTRRDPGDADIWRVTRGGAWGADISLGILTQRLPAPQTFTNALYGFRLARGY